jgi:hypothetical protein
MLDYALHFSVPPVSAVVLSNVMVVDKTFAMFKFLGDRMPYTRIAFTSAFHIMNMTFLLVSTYGALFYCPLGSATSPVHAELREYEQCVPMLSALALSGLLLLWLDRIAFAFLGLPYSGCLGARHRIANGALLVATFSALAVGEPMAMLLLLQSFASRASGSPALDRYGRIPKVALRIYAATMSVVCVRAGGGSASRRSAGISMLIALSGD